MNLPAGSLVLPYLVQNATTYQAMLNNPNDQLSLTPHVWFAAAAANPDVLGHFELTQQTALATTFAVDDSNNLAPFVNDLTFTITSASASPLPTFYVADGSAELPVHLRG